MRTNFMILHSINPKTWRWTIALLLALGLALAWSFQAQAIGPCPSPTQTFDLWAKAGTLTLPDSTTVSVWGYSNSAAGAAQVPGPVLTVIEGICVQVILHNDLSEATSLALHGQGLAADTAGAAAGGSASYTFSATRPGTFFYEAGLTANGVRQVAMGLYGALIVQPATAPTTYSSEAVLVLSEIDPDLNAAPTAFDMGEYHPRYWLINGQAYPNIPAVSIASGSTALLRYINAGLDENSMGLLGIDQQVIKADGYAVPSPYTVVAETLPPGGTLDTLVAVPVDATVGAQYALYSTAQHLDNNGGAYGGQLTSITVAAPALSPVPVTIEGGKVESSPVDPSAPSVKVVPDPVDINTPDIQTP